MKAAPLRFLSAALWPLTIWSSLSHLEEHPADDYVERTSPIVATAIGFWACVGVLVAVLVADGTVFSILDGEGVAQAMRRAPSNVVGALWIIAPALYLIGFWLFAAREALYQR